MAIDLPEIATIIVAFASLVISALAYFVSKRKVFTDLIATNRLDWIKEVRALLTQFINKYLDGAEKNELNKIRYEVELYFGRYKYDTELSKILEKFVENEEDDIKVLLKVIQPVLASPWLRMKLETGVSMKQDTTIANKVRKKMDKIYK